MSHQAQFSKLTMGVCYYPEHWAQSMWASDLDRILSSGIQVVRVAEFAWNVVEPSEGVFDFTLFDRFLDLAHSKGVKVIFCTPTATPPAWAVTRYPEILNISRTGQRYTHGGRKHYTYNSEKYRALTRKITTAFGAHYGGHPAIIGWQLDNEFNCEEGEFYSASDHVRFRAYLQERYDSIDALNDAWGTAFWNQTYESFEQISLPCKVPSDGNNPHQKLDYYRFISNSVLRFAKLQRDILKEYLPEGVFITTNGIFGNIDYPELIRESLDFLCYDSYPNFAFALSETTPDTSYLLDRKWSRELAHVRAFSPTFGIMEQQSSAGGWGNRMEMPNPKPGQTRLWSYQSVAHGADFVSYFRWRTCAYGTEMYWKGILGSDSKDTRFLHEISRTAHELTSIGDIAGAKYRASVAYITDYDNDWDKQSDSRSRSISHCSEKGWFVASQLTHTPMDYICLSDQTPIEKLAAYPLIVYAHPLIMTPARARLLEDYVRGGGCLIVGCGAGQKDIHGRFTMMENPGLLRDLLGVHVNETTLVRDDQPSGASYQGMRLDAPFFNDILLPEEAQVLATYTDDHYAGEAALTCNTYGKGKAYAFGAPFTANNARTLLESLGFAHPWQAYLSLPEGCELAIRENESESYAFILNFMAHNETITINKPCKDLLSAEVVSGEITLPAYGVKVLSLKS